MTYFDDILADDDYRQWKKEFERGQHVVFSDEEKQFLQKAETIQNRIGKPSFASYNGILGQHCRGLL